MRAQEMYRSLERDFITPEMKDEWMHHLSDISELLTENFRRRSMGLVCDYASDISRVYTAVFPSRAVMVRILDDDVTDALLFVHHPAIWDIRKAPAPFQPMEKELVKKFKERRIAIYNLHVPLDNFGEYSTSVNLAKAISCTSLRPFAPYFGGMCGVIGSSAYHSVHEVKGALEKAIGHEARLYLYGGEGLIDGKLAIIAGGGNDVALLRQVSEEGVNTLVTGISVKNGHSKPAHDFAQTHRINIIGGTHYSTESFACQAMVRYFEKMGLPCQFIGDVPVMEDM